ncbi:MAG: PEP/pyruvate-binding domain-containing protein [Syntrophobacteraceae bacterium]
MDNTLLLEQFKSTALTKNLFLTKVDVVIPALFEALLEVVKGYAGKEQQARELLTEYHHSYRNWKFVIQETWRYAVSNVRIFSRHPLNGSIVYLLSRILIDALKEAQTSEVRSVAADHLLALWIKLADEMPQELSSPLPKGVHIGEIEKTLGSVTYCHEGILRSFFLELSELSEASFENLFRSYYQIKRFAGKLHNIWTSPLSFEEFRPLLTRCMKDTYRFWLEKEDLGEWLARQKGGDSSDEEWRALCLQLSHKTYLGYLERIETDMEAVADNRDAVAQLAQLPDFNEIVRSYFKIPEKLKAYEDSFINTHLSLLMRLKIMQIRGLESIHEETLREINFDMAKAIGEERKASAKGFLGRVLDVLQECLLSYPEAALQVLNTTGLGVIETGDRDLIESFLRRVVLMGFQTPQLAGVSEYWQVAMNPAHLPNIRVWLEIIKKDPSRTKSLLSALIVNLSLAGIYIRDTDLFQKDVSRILHAPIRNVYNLVKQLAKLFPVYFNQIGAEGQLRTVSTDVDELTGRADRLIHFLRKQSHVESNNVIVNLIEEIIDFWRTLDKSRISIDLVPPEVYSQIRTSGPLVDEVHRIIKSIFEATGVNDVKGLLDLPEEKIAVLIGQVPEASEQERRRAFLLLQFYQLLHEKYALSFKDMDIQLQRAAALGLPDTTNLLSKLHCPEPFEKLDAILDYLLEVKEVILSQSELHILENIYYKRHIAVDIPSMYGSYNEKKFDALGLTFRLENMANVLFEEIIYSLDLSFITRASFAKISKFLPLFIKALEIDGIASSRLELQAELFYKANEVPRFSHSQYMDIFRGFSEAIKQIIHTNYHAVHEENLDIIIKQLGQDKLRPRYRRENQSESSSERLQRVSESFLRDLIARTFGLQYFDYFISSILTTLATQKEELSAENLDLLLSYDPEKTVSKLCRPNPATYDLIHMGNKGYHLAKLHSFNIQIPPGFVITTEYFRCRSVIENFQQPSDDYRDKVMANIKEIEKATGRIFGRPSNPLLLSVRSGSSVSMPGMMSTFLNVGINERIVEGLIGQMGQTWFAWDNYRRFIQSWAMSFGVQRGEFDSIMRDYKNRFGVQVKREFLPDEMRILAQAYKDALKKHNIELSDDPKEQLFMAIQKVMASWYYPKATTYREIMGISENWGTAVTVQAMIFGNLDTNSGAGVMFTHDPRTSEDQIDPVGDFTWGNQGEDVVGGLVQTLPFSEKQRQSEVAKRPHSLESLFPKVYERLVDVARNLIYEQNWAPQEIEFAFQGGHEDGVYVLQSRNMTPRVKRHFPVFRSSEDLHESYLGSGIGVSGGALSGLVAFDLDSIQHLRKEHPGRHIILIRSDTVPDDIREISVADGILTGKGGATSHAAIVAHRLGKTCVVGFNRMRIWEVDYLCFIDEHVLQTGDSICIDGRSGAVYLGVHETEQVAVMS